jgi:hypothetical protein
MARVAEVQGTVMIRRVILISLTLILTLLMPAQAQTPSQVYLPVTLNRVGKATVTGMVFSSTLNQYYVGGLVWLAQVYCGGVPYGCAWALSVPGSPVTRVDDQGAFIFANLDFPWRYKYNPDVIPGEYVIIIGNPEGCQFKNLPIDPCEIVVDDKDYILTWQTQPGETLDVGQLNVHLDAPVIQQQEDGNYRGEVR